jgi:hypothetical protein
MAKVFQIVATNENDQHFEEQLINGEYHAALDPERTFCGIQLDGDDGYASGEIISGVVTCALCAKVIIAAKRIRNWQPRT